MRLLLVWGFVLLTTVAALADSQRQRVRTTDPLLDGLLDEGRRRSATFRHLVDSLEAAEWIVFVQPGLCPDRAAIGCLMHVVGNFEGRRYLRLLVNPAGRHPDQVITILAHELQHALEVVSDGGVTDGPSLLALMRRISSSRFRTSKAAIYETAEARRVEHVVFRELRAW